MRSLFKDFASQALALLLLGSFESVAAENNDVAESLVCDLQTCWTSLSRKAVQLGKDTVATVGELIATAQEHDQRIVASEKGDVALSFRIAILKATLEECENLNIALNGSATLILVGHALYEDDMNFELAARTVRDAEKGPVIVIRDTDKIRLKQILSLLPDESLRRFVYVGHGIPRALVIGPKNLLLPKDWRPGLKLSRADWQRASGGMLYEEDLFSSQGAKVLPELKRALSKDAHVDLYACDTGASIARAMAGQLDAAVVSACQIGMHFEYRESPGGPWLTDWARPVPRSAHQTRLVQDAEGTFGEVNKESPPVSPPLRVDAFSGKADDTAASDIVLRLSLGSANSAWIESRKKMVIFTPEDLSQIRAEFGTQVSRNGWNTSETLTWKGLKARIEAREGGKALAQKIALCVAESVALYYPQ